MMTSLAKIGLLLSLPFMLAAPAGAQQSSLGPATAKVRIQQVQVALIGSGQFGGGTLTYRGRNYRIDVGGVGFGGIGASRLTATGTVYGLTRLEDFPGAYAQLRQGWAVGDRGGGVLWLRNTNGVTLKLATRRKGLQFTLGADGVLISFKR